MAQWLLRVGVAFCLCLPAFQVRAEDPILPPEGDPIPPEEDPIDPPEDSGGPADVEQQTMRLSEKFHVDSDVISELRSQNMGYGEIGHALTLANTLPGGATTENIDQVMALREQGMGWGKIAHELDTKLGAAKKVPIQEPEPPEPDPEPEPEPEPDPLPEPDPVPDPVAESGTSLDGGAESLIRSGLTPGKAVKGKGLSGGLKAGGTNGNRGGSLKGNGALKGNGTLKGNGGLKGGGWQRGGSLGGSGVTGSRGKSSSAPGHNK